MASASERWQELKGQFVNWLAQGAKDLHNHVVPAFPTYVHGVDQPGTPLSMGDQAAKPSFEEMMARQAPKPREREAAADRGMEL